MSITIELSVDEEARIQERASARGQSVGDYLKMLAQNAEALPTAKSVQTFSYGPADGNLDPTGRAYDAAAAIAFVRKLQNATVPDNENEREDNWERLQNSLDEDRPGQRSIFGMGVNPYPADYVSRNEPPDWMRDYDEFAKP